MFFLLKYGVGIRVPCSGRLSYINPDCFISKLLISHCPLETIVYNLPFVSQVINENQLLWKQEERLIHWLWPSIFPDWTSHILRNSHPLLGVLPFSFFHRWKMGLFRWNFVTKIFIKKFTIVLSLKYGDRNSCPQIVIKLTLVKKGYLTSTFFISNFCDRICNRNTSWSCEFCNRKSFRS